MSGVVRLAGLALIAYAIVILLYTALYTWWSGSSLDLRDVIAHQVAIAIVLYGLWNLTHWGWWLASSYSAVALSARCFDLWLFIGSTSTNASPYPIADNIYTVLSAALIGAALVLLLSPAGRAHLALDMPEDSDQAEGSNP